MRLLTLLFILITVTSCNQTTEKSTEIVSVSVDSLTGIFNEGWNKKDSSAIMNVIAQNAVVINDSLIHNGHKAIADHWVSGGVKVISNIKTTSVIKNSDNILAYNSGTYSLDLTPPGEPVLKEKGNYSMVWTKQQDGNWKLTLIHIEDITRMPDIK